ncbi:unnamed protein product [Symbiodinium sp. CCMP2592]|nr:unnamed protein product [Symbiodinium sp. CCMP2592]
MESHAEPSPICTKSCLLSGRCIEISALPDWRLTKLLQVAEEHFRDCGALSSLERLGWLVAPEQGSMLDMESTVYEARLGSVHFIQAIAVPLSQPIFCTASPDHPSWAQVLGDGSVTTWGSGPGSDSRSVRHQLQNVRSIAATSSAFAALRKDGTVVTWGHPDQGGDSTPVKAQLREVKSLAASDTAFAALLASGGVVTWGGACDGGDCELVRDELTGVTKIAGTCCAFAALLENGRVVQWGDHFADTGSIRDELKCIQDICGLRTRAAFAALLQTGKVVTWQDWRDPDLTPSPRARQMLQSNVVQLHASEDVFEAFRDDGTKISWPEAGECMELGPGADEDGGGFLNPDVFL